MAPHDTFPQRVWHIVASIPEGYLTTYGEGARLAGSPRAARQVGGVLKRLPEGSTVPWHPAARECRRIRQSPWRYLPHRPRSTAAASGAAGRGCAGLRQRPYRSPALSLGLLKAKKKPPSGGVASLLGDRNCGLLDRNQRQVGMSATLVYDRLHGIGNKHQLAVNRDRRA